MIGWPQTLMVAQGSGTAVTAAARTSVLTGAAAHAKKLLPANFFNYIGQTLRVEASGRISSLITTPGTARFEVRLGAISVFDGLAVLLDTVAGHTNVGWKLVVEMTLQIVGTAAQFHGEGTWTCEDILGVPATAPKGVLTAMLPWNAAPALGTAFDGTVANVLDLFFTQTVATGSCQMHQYKSSAPNGFAE